MAIWAIADLHLSFGVPNKKMDAFGPQWHHHAEKIENKWKKNVFQTDLVLIPGDISWAMRLEEAIPDLEWIDHLPGTKVVLRGNHDYWWPSLSKLSKILPPSIHPIQNNAFHWEGVGIAGARLWDTPEYRFDKYIELTTTPEAKSKQKQTNREKDEKIFQRELARLELSLKCLKEEAKTRIVMTHYPPVSASLQSSQASSLLKKYHTNICVFGHLHNVHKNLPMFGEKEEISYFLTSCDYLNFSPLKILD